MEKLIEIEFEKGDRFVAKLFEKEAPNNCKTIWNSLPIEGEAIHAAYAGQCVWFVTKEIALDAVHKENQKVLGNLPGTIALEAYPPETNLHRTEINIVYGPNFYPRTPFAGEHAMNRVGIIEDNLDRLLKLGIDIRENGKQKVIIRRKE